MKKHFLLLAMLFGLFVLTQNAFALADVANDTVSVIETDDSFIFYGIVQFTATDSTNDITTQAIQSEYCDWSNAVINIYGNAVSGADVNVYLRGGSSLDLTYIASVYTQTTLDAKGAAAPTTWFAFKDTVTASKVVFTDPVAGLPYKVLEFDGQAGNKSTVDITWFLTVPKKSGAPKRGCPYSIQNTT